MVLEFLDFADIAAVQNVSKKWNLEIKSSDRIWKLKFFSFLNSPILIVKALALDTLKRHLQMMENQATASAFGQAPPTKKSREYNDVLLASGSSEEERASRLIALFRERVLSPGKGNQLMDINFKAIVQATIDSFAVYSKSARVSPLWDMILLTR
jgi:hypothetical protein